MSKRNAKFRRRARDYYVTPKRPVTVLSPFLRNVDGFCEPCVGNGALVRHLEALGHRCTLALDLQPTGEAESYADTRDALTLASGDLRDFTHFITNPPWPAARGGNGEPTMSLVRHLSSLRPTWLLLSADFAHNSYATEALQYCPMIASVGRIQWMPGSKHVGMDNCAWYLFDQKHPGLPTFFPRVVPHYTVFAADIEALL